MIKNFIAVTLVSFLFLACGSDDKNSSSDTSTTYTTVINDSFNYHDQTTWQKANWANNNPFYSAWCPEQISFNNSILNIKLEQKTCNGKTHASGEYRTYNTYKYGKYTVRMKASNVEGTISSLFTYTGSSDGNEHDEIDIEILGKDTTKIQVNYWRNGNEHPKTINLGFDASADYHTYSFIWSKESIKWYVDNRLIYTVNENHNNDNDSLPINAGKIMINLWAATGVNSWSGVYTNGTVANTYYDYVKFEREN